MKKMLSMVAALAISVSVFSGCSKPAVAPKPVAPDTSKTDALTTASIVNKPEAFLKAISKDGTWIIATLNDIKIDKDLVLEGEFKNTKTPPVLQRKIGLYTQDDKHVVTARFTLTAPKLTIKSPMASVEHGTFIGDIYVETNDFQLKDNKVTGNIYFKDDAAKAGFKMDAKSTVSGKQEVKK